MEWCCHVPTLCSYNKMTAADNTIGRLPVTPATLLDPFDPVFINIRTISTGSHFRVENFIRYLKPIICSFISVITVKQTIHLPSFMIYWAMTHFCWMWFVMLSISHRPQFRPKSLNTSSLHWHCLQPVPRLLGPALLVLQHDAMLGYDETTWSQAPALQTQPKPIKQPHCGVGVQATGLRLRIHVSRRERGGCRMTRLLLL